MDTAPVNNAAVPVEVVLPAAFRADIRRLLYLVNRLHLLLALPIPQQPSLPSTHCRHINNLQLSTNIVGQLIAQYQSTANRLRSRFQPKSRILSVGEDFFA